MKTYQYLLITSGIILGLAGGITIGVSEAEDIQEVARMPQDFMLKVAGTNAQQPVIPFNEIISQYEQDGSRVTDIELDRELTRDVYELEVVDATGQGWDMDIDARTGEVLSKHRDWDD